MWSLLVHSFLRSSLEIFLLLLWLRFFTSGGGCFLRVMLLCCFWRISSFVILFLFFLWRQRCLSSPPTFCFPDWIIKNFLWISFFSFENPIFSVACHLFFCFLKSETASWLEENNKKELLPCDVSTAFFPVTCTKKRATNNLQLFTIRKHTQNSSVFPLTNKTTKSTKPTMTTQQLGLLKNLQNTMRTCSKNMSTNGFICSVMMKETVFFLLARFSPRFRTWRSFFSWSTVFGSEPWPTSTLVWRSSKNATQLKKQMFSAGDKSMILWLIQFKKIMLFPKRTKKLFWCCSRFLL